MRNPLAFLIGLTFPLILWMSASSIAIGQCLSQAAVPGRSTASCQCPADRYFIVSSRHLASSCVAGDWDSLRFFDSSAGRCRPLSAVEYQALIEPSRTVVFYVHGNRMPADELMTRFLSVRRFIRPWLEARPVDWVVFSWPSAKDGFGVSDFRKKAGRCDLEAVHLAGLLKRHVDHGSPMAMIGYSFGARVATGALHLLGGGRMERHVSSEDPVQGAEIRVGLIAPAIESLWLAQRGYHGLATKNMASMTLLYNRRDAVLKRYWLLEKVRRETALGFSGPTRFAPRFDGMRLSVRSRDCSPNVKLRHAELDYYGTHCNAGRDLALMINSVQEDSAVIDARLVDVERGADARTNRIP